MNGMTLTEFLLARIAEDEARARPAWEARATRRVLGLPVESTWPTPDRVLAECEAKRRIVEEHSRDFGEFGVDPCDAHDAEMRSIDCDTLRFLALPAADHPDYREEWRP